MNVTSAGHGESADYRITIATTMTRDEIQDDASVGFAMSDIVRQVFKWRKTIQQQPLQMQGVDVSRWQGDNDQSTPELDVDWERVYQAGYRFAIIKLTEGIGYDWQLGSQLSRGCRDAGMLLQYYHFGTPHYISRRDDHMRDAIKEAEDFVDALSLCPHPDLMTYTSGRQADVWLDLEGKADNLTPQQGLEWCQMWLDVVEAAGYRAGLYTSARWLDRETSDPAALSVRTDGSIRPIWVARYGHNDGMVPEGYDPNKKVPLAWLQYDVWQYTSRGDVPGVAKKCDLNIAGVMAVGAEQ